MIILTPIQIPIDLLTAKGLDNVVTYNLTSYCSRFPTLNLLIPSAEIMPESSLDGDITEIPTFDIAYGNGIMSNNEAFLQFMSIMIPVFQSPTVLVQILINHSEFRDAITESLAKLIQQRYGYNVYIINELEDFFYAEESSFSIPGLFAMDQDIARWHSLCPPQEGDLYE